MGSIAGLWQVSLLKVIAEKTDALKLFAYQANVCSLGYLTDRYSERKEEAEKLEQLGLLEIDMSRVQGVGGDATWSPFG